MFKNERYDEKTDTIYWLNHEQDIDISKFIEQKNIDFLQKHYNLKPSNYKNRKTLKITKCKECEQYILSHKVREYCSQDCHRISKTKQDNNHQLILKFEREYNIKLDECSYKFIDNNNLLYKPRPFRNRQIYTITVDELLNIYKDQAKRTQYGEMMNKFYKIYKLKEEEWTEEQVDSLIEDIFEWLDNNEDHITITEYFRKHLINPLVLKHLKQSSNKFNEFYTEMEVYAESIITNKALKGEFNGNFSTKYLQTRNPHWEDKGNNLSVSQLPVIINLPSNDNNKPLNLDKTTIIENKKIDDN